jgi:hypothetical protein
MTQPRHDAKTEVHHRHGQSGIRKDYSREAARGTNVATDDKSR